jgi:hypothetical protein
MENKKLLICISFHYVESRIENLKKIVDCFLNYILDTTIIIDCNQNLKLFEKYGNVIIKTHDNLPHPFHLTSVHRLTMVDEIENFDYFMYVEDDMLLPYENFLEYINNFDELYKINCVPSFVRIEEFNDVEYIVDLTKNQVEGLKININNKTFINLNQPYHAFWILPNKELKESINENFKMISTNRELSASYVMWGLNKTPYVLMDGNKINKLSCSYHLTNNYSKMVESPFGKIRFDSVIFN